MSNTADVLVSVLVDVTEAEAKLKDFQNEVNELDRESKTVFARVREEAGRVLRLLSSIISFTKNIIRALGLVLDPYYEMVMNTVFAASQTMIAIGLAYLALPVVGFAIYAVIATAAFSLSIYATSLVGKAKQESASQLQGIIAALSNIQSMAFMGFR